MLVKKKNGPSRLGNGSVQMLRPKNKSCAACGGHFFPRYLYSVFCDFCSTPSTSFLAIPQATFLAAMAA